jgi:hypothetical protein
MHRLPCIFNGLQAYIVGPHGSVGRSHLRTVSGVHNLGCIKPKMRSANDQHERNPASTATTEQMIRLLSSSRWARSGMECVRCASPKAVVSDMESLSDYVSKITHDRALLERRHIPCAVRSYATEQNNHPKHELCAHPPLPMSEPQPLWKHVRAGYDDDI